MALALAGGCRRVALVGSLSCSAAADCAPPSTVCGPDGRCVPGCGQQPNACTSGATCNLTNGECEGAPPMPCVDDRNCDPPALVCRPSTSTCVTGCILSGCAMGFLCNPSTGRCCDDLNPDCPQRVDMGAHCNSDSECVGAPANICSGGQCVPGCATSGCTAPLICTSTTGHCALPICRSDADCDRGSYCSQSGACVVLSFAGPMPCAGGTRVTYTCAQKTTPADFTTCAGAPGPVGCPYCIDGSCFHPGLCSTMNDCHAGDDCTGGLCRARAPACPQTVPLADVASGQYAAGKELCVTGRVSSVRLTGSDGMTEVKLGTIPYLFVDESEVYRLRVPAVGETITVHGTVRWDAGHNDYEILPVDWISP